MTLILRNERLLVEVTPFGGQLSRLIFDGIDRLWHGDPIWWNFRAPILFPVIGKSPDGQVEINGQSYPMPSHGFARDHTFETITEEGGSDRTRLTLTQRAATETLAHYPFAYRLTLRFQLSDLTLTQEAVIANDGQDPMPFCFGYHPAFLWPFDPGAQKSDYLCRFDQSEPAPIRRSSPETGLLLATRFPSPVTGGNLTLSDALFTEGAMQFEHLCSRALWYGRRGMPGLRIEFPDSPQLGLWTKPGAPFLCVEPWQGLAAESSGSARLDQRPGALMLAPGAEARYRLILRFAAPDPG